MKNRTFRVFFGFIAVFGMLWILTLGACAGDGDIPEEYGDFLESVPDGVREMLPDGVFSQDGTSLGEGAKEASAPLFLIGAVTESLGASVGALVPTLCVLLGVITLSAALYAISSFVGANLSGAVALCVRLCTYCAISGVAVASLGALGEYFNSLFSVMSSFVPLSGVLFAMGGNLSAAVSETVTLSAVLSLCQFICVRTVIPVFCLCLSLLLVSAFDGVGAEAGRSLSSSVRKWYITALGFVAAIMTASLSAQSILSSKTDGAMMRGAKIAVSSFVPVTGGTLASTLGTLASSVELIRGAVGTIGIVVLLLMLIPIVVELAILRFFFDVSAFAAGLLGCSGEQKLLTDISGLYGYLEGVAALSAAIFIIAIAIFAVTASAV